MLSSKFRPGVVPILSGLGFVLLTLAGSAEEADPVGRAGSKQEAAENAENFSIEQLRAELLGSLRDDLLALRAKKDASLQGVTALAQALALVAAEPAPMNSGVPGTSPTVQTPAWNASIQAYGSEKSMALGLRLARAVQREQSSKAENLSKSAEELGQRVARLILEVKTAGELDPILEEFEEFLPQDRLPQTKLPKELIGKLTQLQQFLISWQNYLIVRERGDHIQALQTLRVISEQPRNLPWIPRSQLSNLFESAAKLSGRLSPEEFSNTVKRVIEQALTVEKTEALDSLLEELTHLRALMNADGQNNQFQQQLYHLMHFLEGWQEALAFHAAGNAREFQNKMQQLQSHTTTNLEIPRSALLNRIQRLIDARIAGKAVIEGGGPRKFESPEAVMDRMVRIENIEADLDDLRSALGLVSPGREVSMEWQRRTSALEAIAKHYVAIKEGQTVELNRAIYGSEASNPRVAALHTQLMLLSLERSVGDEAKVPPEPKDTPLTYVRRLLDAAKKEQRWELAYRTMATAEGMSIQAPFFGSNDSAALLAFITGQTQDRARQFSFAVSSYLEALKKGSTWLPAEVIGARLEQIAKDHPVDYKEGIEQARRPEAPAPEVPYIPPVSFQTPDSVGSWRGQGKKPVAPAPAAVPEKKGE